MDYSLILLVLVGGFAALKYLKGFNSKQAQERIESISGKKESANTDTQPDDVFNVLEIDVNRGTGRFIERTNPKDSGYVLNPDHKPLRLLNSIPVGSTLRVFQRGKSRDITPLFYNISWKLNPSAPEIKRVLEMSALQKFITMSEEDSPILMIIAGIIFLAILGFIAYTVNNLWSGVKILLELNGVPMG